MTHTRFQDFNDRSNPGTVAPRVAQLRQAMHTARLDAYLVPRGDAFRGEYVPPNAERLAWLTGFTGSAGLAIVAADKAALFVDGRYVLQAPEQTDTDVFAVCKTKRPGMPEELAEYVPDGARLGYDPWLFSPHEVEALRRLLGDKTTLCPSPNLIDEIWTTDRPVPPTSPIEVLDSTRTGVSCRQKLTDLRKTLAQEDADALFLGLPESVCWLFNIRGHEVPHTPFVLAFALVPRTGRPTIFLNTGSLNAEAHRLDAEVDFADIPAITAHLLALADDGKSVWLDPATAPSAVFDKLTEAETRIIAKPDPVLPLKARKNAAEMAGMRDAHHRDGVALAKFLAWFDETAPQGGLTEIDCVAKLEDCRAEDAELVDISFDTIAGAGPNGAIIHYRVTTTTNRTLVPGELFLLDSGGQYRSGTTDITRTLSTGPVPDEVRDRNTRVLKGMIEVSMLSFPAGTTGAQIDIMARRHLWDIGLDYSHGTGHGVGAYLSVHEGPVGISPRARTPLAPGHVISNEPGYYQAGAYGIRIENLVHVIEHPQLEGFLAFETLTLAPIDTRLVDPALLTDAERGWLNAYHARVFNEIGPELDSKSKEWLREATRPI